MSKISKKNIKQKIDENYQEIIDYQEVKINQNNSPILRTIIDGVEKMKQPKSEKESKNQNQLESMIIKMFSDSKNKLENMIENKFLESKNNLENMIDNKFSEVKNNLENVIDNKFSKFNSNIDEKFGELNDKMISLEDRINNRFDKLEQRIERIENTPTMKRELN